MGSAWSYVPALIKSGIVLFLFMGCAAGSSAGEPAAYPQNRETGSLSFPVSLYTALKGRQGNLSFSPESISSVLAMAYEGARSTTREQMAEVLHVPLDRDRFHDSLKNNTLGKMPSAGQGGVRLNVANALWGQTGYPFLKGFLDDLARYHSSELRQVDFSGRTEAARSTINGWVEEMTLGIIRDLIGQGIITPETRLVLTNAVYFKGMWASQFLQKNTRPGRFLLGPDNTTTVDMMEQTGDFRYLETSGVKILEMPYEGGGLSMVIILPAAQGGLPTIEESFSPSGLGKWMDDLGGRSPGQVRVRLPRFKVSTEFDLSKTLSGMGMPEAFGAGADFSGMTGAAGLFIGNVIHKAFVEVNEEGTEAAAATAAVMTKSVPMVREFHADHPFLFLIRESRTGTVLFMGRVADPRA